jgi:hypothetical protein
MSVRKGYAQQAMNAKRRNGAFSEKRRRGNRAKEILGCFAEAGKQMGELSDEAVLNIVRRCREKMTKARQSCTKDSKEKFVLGHHVEGHSGRER